MQEQDLDASSGLTYPIRIIISLVIAIIPVIVFLLGWYNIRGDFPDLNLTETQRLEELVYQIAIGGLIFVSTFLGVYSFLKKRS